MNNTKFLILIILGFTLLRCKPTNDNSCSFEELRSESVTTESLNGHKIKLEAEAKIKGNLRQLADLEGKIGASDSIYVNLEKTISKKEVIYPPDFLIKHNAIINGLCNLERKLRDTALPITMRLDFNKQLTNGIAKYFELLFGKEPKPVNIPPTGSTIPNNDRRVPSTIQIPNLPTESNTDVYFNKNVKTEVAILATSEYKKSDSKISSDVSAYFTSKGLANNPVFFKSPFISKFSDRLKDNDIAVFNGLDVQKTVNCVCLINQENLKIEDKAYENNSFKKASASYSITLFYLNGSANPQTFQFNCQGTDSDGNKAQEYLKDDFINSFKNLSINFNQCKK